MRSPLMAWSLIAGVARRWSRDASRPDAWSARGASGPAGVMAVVEFDEAVRRALAANLEVAQAAQSILQAEALLQVRAVGLVPHGGATVTTTLYDAERSFNGQVSQPQTQSAIGGFVSYPVLAAARWAQAVQAADRVRVARIGAEETRRQIAIATSEAYLRITALKREVEVNELARANAQAQLDYAHDATRSRRRQQAERDSRRPGARNHRGAARRGAARCAAGAGSPRDPPGRRCADRRRPENRSSRTPVTDDAWIASRTDIRLFSAQVDAAERVARDSWKDWVPVGTASFQPQFLTPAGIFQSSGTWSVVAQFAVPIFDGGVRQAAAKERNVLAETARLELTDGQLRARSEQRIAQAAVESSVRGLASARLAAQHADEALRITDIAFRAGATTNLEVIDAQRRARDTDTLAVDRRGPPAPGSFRSAGRARTLSEVGHRSAPDAGARSTRREATLYGYRRSEPTPGQGASSCEGAMRLELLDSGSCEGIKGTVHGAALGLTVIMGLYNAAAWLRRRERHLAINTVLYTAVTIWEYQHVVHHRRALFARVRARRRWRHWPQEPPEEPPFAA